MRREKRGIVPGLSIAAALALDQGIAIHLRDERAEAHALKSIALWAGQWTSTISIEPPASVLLEIAGGLDYFGGLEKLLGRIDAGLVAIGFPGVVATAPTAGAASLLARGAGRSSSSKPSTVRALSPPCPWLCSTSAQAELDTLSGIGVRTIGECDCASARWRGPPLRTGAARRSRSCARNAARPPNAVRCAGTLSRPARAARTGRRSRSAAVRRPAPGRRARRVPAWPWNRSYTAHLRSRPRGRGADVDRAGAELHAAGRAHHERAARAARARSPRPTASRRSGSFRKRWLPWTRRRATSFPSRASTMKPRRSSSNACARGWARMRCARSSFAPIIGPSGQGTDYGDCRSRSW